MNNERVYLDYVHDMLDSAEKAIRFVGEMQYEQFSADDKTVFAVIRAIEIIGEGSKKIPKEIQKDYSEIPWREIAGTRDKLIHEYFGVNLSVVWRTVHEDLPPLLKQLRGILEDFGYYEN